VENAGSGGKRGIRWKTRNLVENAGPGGKSGGPVENAGSAGGGKHEVPLLFAKYELSSLK